MTETGLVTGCERNISGYYLESNNSAVRWLQVVRTSDNHLTGQLAARVVKPNGVAALGDSKSPERNTTSAVPGPSDHFRSRVSA